MKTGRIIDEDSEVRLYYAETVSQCATSPRQPNPQSDALCDFRVLRQSDAAV